MIPPLTPLQAKIYSKLGMRGTFSVAIEEVASRSGELIVLTADLASLTGLTRFKEKYPSQFFNVGIAEQNMIGIAAGMAKEGKNVFVTTYANFLAMRAYEQIRIQLCYMGLNVKVVGSGSGLAMGMSGNTHYGIEDLSLMRAIPGLVVISPADGVETVKTVIKASEHEGPVYIRLSGVMNCPVVYTRDYEFSIGKGVLLRKGDNISIIATGTMVHESIIAADILDKQGISSTVVNMHTIKPLDTSIIREMCLQSNIIVTVEEHTVIGGLSGAVSEYLSGVSGAPRLVKIGLPDMFQTVGDYQYLLKENCLTGPQIADRILKEYISHI